MMESSHKTPGQLASDVFIWFSTASWTSKDLLECVAFNNEFSLISRSELLLIFAYCFVAAEADSGLSKKLDQLRTAAQIPDAFLGYLQRIVVAKIDSVSDVFTVRNSQLSSALADAVVAWQIRLRVARRKVLKGLRYEAFQHPVDAAMRAKIYAVPGVQLLMENGVKLWCESEVASLTGTALEVNSDGAMTALWTIFEEACEALDMHGSPRLFVEQGGMWSRSLPGTQPIVVIASGTVSVMNRDELLFLLGRELGHIKAGHLVLQVTAAALESTIKMSSTITLGIAQLAADVSITPLISAWLRYAELTADRAGYLVCQDREVALRALAKLSGYPPLLGSTLHPSLLAEQALRFEREMATDGMRRFLHINQLWSAKRPFPVIRTIDLLRWLSDGYPEELLAMSAEELEKVQCWMAEDPALVEMILRIQDVLSSWTVQRFGVRKKKARQIFRRLLMQDNFSLVETELHKILQISLEVMKATASAIKFGLIIVFNEDGKAKRFTIPLEQIDDWEQVPDQYREDLIRYSVGEPLLYDLYSV